MTVFTDFLERTAVLGLYFSSGARNGRIAFAGRGIIVVAFYLGVAHTIIASVGACDLYIRTVDTDDLPIALAVFFARFAFIYASFVIITGSRALFDFFP